MPSAVVAPAVDGGARAPAPRPSAGFGYHHRMDDGSVHSFTFDRESASQAYRQVGLRPLVLAVLASVPAREDWEGCIVFLGPSPGDESRTACVGIRGGGSEALQEALVAAFERAGVRVTAIYEGGPEVDETVAKASGGRWVAA